MKVCILLATYNGHQYIEEQLQSIYAQTFSGEILIRINDDGSNDETIEKINEFRKINDSSNRGILVTAEKQGGHLENFRYLIKSAPQNFDYYFFCDQDDYWLSNKIERSIRNMEENCCTMYASSVQNVNSQLRNLDVSHYYYRSGIIRNTLTEKYLYTYTQGCTIGIECNRFLSIQKEFPETNLVEFHDYWLGLSSIIQDKVYYDRNVTIKYRVHSSNASVSDNHSNKFTYKFKKYIKGNEISKKRFRKRIDFFKYLLEKRSHLLDEKEIKHLKKIISSSNSIFKRLMFVIFKYRTKNKFAIGLKRRFDFVLGRM